MPYQRVTLPDTNIGDPGPLPPELVGLDDATLADLSAGLNPDACEELGYVGQGFVWVDPPTPPPVVPQTVSRMQAKLALLAAGKLDEIETYMASDAADAATRIYWQDVSDLHRDHPLVASITALLGLTSDQVDALFIAAAAIT